MDQLHTAYKVCGGCCAISLNTVDTESSVSPMYMNMYIQELSINVSTIVNACDTTKVITAKIDTTSHNM